MELGKGEWSGVAVDGAEIYSGGFWRCYAYKDKP